LEDLGLEMSCDTPEHNWMELCAADKAFMLGVGKADGFSPVNPGQNAVVTLTVEDLEAAKSELEAKDITVGEIVEVPGHVKMAFVQDPDGNYFHLTQELD
jgi:predicted enzyme related to lactoylglutathione lyase